MTVSTKQHSSPFASNVPKYFGYTALKGLSFGLIIATWVIFLQEQHGLSLTQVTLIDVAFWIASTLGEVPTGVVADTMGRKISIAIGAAIMGASTLGWAFAPTVLLITTAYILLALGATFLSGADEAFFYESLQAVGRAGDYTRLAGRISATMLAAIALGNVASGLLATLDLRLPFVVAGVGHLAMLGIALSFREPEHAKTEDGEEGKSYRAVLRQAVAILRARPALRYPILYLTIVPLTAMIMETVFLQPQAIALGVPIAGVGFIVMAVQFVKIAGATASYRIKERFREGTVFYLAPTLIIASLILLAAIQSIPALLLVGVLSLVTATLRPLLMSRIQHEVGDHVRATVFSLQALMAALLAALGEPLLGLIADHFGLPAAYVALAGSLAILLLWLFSKGRAHFP